MKKFIINIIIITSFFLAETSAQQEAMYSQYMYNILSINPAYAGTKEAVNIILLSRNQWVGFEGAPKTNSLTIHSPVLKSNIGAGFSIIKDQIGPLDITNIFFDVASEIKIHEGGFLSLGIKAGIDARKTNLTNLRPLEKSDETYAKDLISNFNPNFGTGVYYYTSKYYAGLSTPKIVAKEIENENFKDGGEKMERHYFFIGGYVHDINEDYKLKPSMLLKKVKGAPSSLDLSVSTMYKNKIIGGVSNRFGDSFGFNFQIKIIQQFWFGYAYDLTVSKLGKYNSGTHEIMLYYDTELLKKGIIKSPRFF